MTADKRDPEFVTNPRLAIAPDSAFVRKAAEAAPKKRRKVKPVEAGCEGKKVIGSRAVDDPYEAGAKLTARVNLAEHPLEWLAARNKIDTVQYLAGRAFRALYERAEIGSARGIDPAKVKVDGGAPRDPLDAGVAEAHHRLNVIARKVGKIAYALLSRIAGAGETVTRVAATWPMDGGREAREKFIAEALRKALGALAGALGMEAKATGPASGPIRGVVFEQASVGGVDDPAMRGHVDMWLEKRGVTMRGA